MEKNSLSLYGLDSFLKRKQGMGVAEKLIFVRWEPVIESAQY